MTAGGVRRGILALLLGSASSQLIALATLPILGRIYGPVAFGTFALFLSLSALIGLVAALRYEYAIVLPDRNPEAVWLKRLSVTLVAVTSILTVLVTLGIFMLSGDRSRTWWVLLLGVSVLLAGVTSTLFFWFTRQRRFGVQSTSRVVQASAAAIAQVSLGWIGAPSGELLIIGYIVGQVCGLAVLVAKDDSRRFRHPQERGARRALMHRYRKMPLYNAPNVLLDGARINGINLLIGANSVAVLGQFSMAWKVGQAPVALIASSVSQVYLQQMAAAAHGELLRLVKGVLVRSLVLGLVPMCALGVFAPTLVPWFLGEEWGQAGLLVQALVPWFYVNLATAPLSNVFVVAGRQGTMLGFAIIYLVVPLSVLAFWPASVVAAVWAMSLCMTMLLVILILMSLRVARLYDQSH